MTTREAWLRRTLQDIPAGLRILDAGAGECQYRRFCDHLDYTSQDFAQYEGGHGHGGLQTGTWDNSKIDIVSDITDIPVESASFDAVMCVEVLEHVPDPRAAVKELVRVLRPGGTLVLTAPFNSLTHFAPYHYSTGFSRYFYEEILAAHGCDIVELAWNGNYFETLAQELRRLDSVGRDYAGQGMNLLEKIACAIILRRTSRMTSADTGSHELSAFGVHVRAVRRERGVTQPGRNDNEDALWDR